MYFIKEGYQCNSQKSNYVNHVFEALHNQIPIYKIIAEKIQEKNLDNLLDIGCGTGIKLAKYIFPVFGYEKKEAITGIDFACHIEFCRIHYQFGIWNIDDVENPDSKIVRKKFDIIVVADVIEHLMNPDKLFEYIKVHSNAKTIIALSTPERDVVRGFEHFGPPPNPHHIREWNKEEFENYVCHNKLKIQESFLVKENFRGNRRGCLIIIANSECDKKCQE